MRIVLHIGADAFAADRLQRVLAAQRRRLAARGVLFPRAPGARNHDALWAAVAHEGCALRTEAGCPDDGAQAAFRERLADTLRTEIVGAAPDLLILSAHQLAGQADAPSIAALRALLGTLSDDIRVVAHLDDPARMLARRFAAQVLEGRARPLGQELALLDAVDLRAAARATWPDADTTTGLHPEVQGAPLWLSPAGLVRAWEAAFGTGRVALRTVSPAMLDGTGAADEARAAFGIEARLPPVEPGPGLRLPSAAWLARARAFNAVLLRLCAQDRVALPGPALRALLAQFAVPGPAIDAGSLHALNDRLAPELRALAEAHPGLDPARLDPDPRARTWHEADPGFGFRATQWLCAFRPLIARAARPATAKPPAPSDRLPAPARAKYADLAGGPYAPHDDLPPPPGPDPAFPDAKPRGTGRTVIACMKNEGPFLLEWLAFHQAVGFDGVLVYSNDCDDGTDAMLNRLAELGHVAHRDNSGWTGRSPQTHALDRALDEPLVRDAAWIAHFDVDEFVNVQVGDGTLDALFDAVPDATHIAMTWRLFGHGGVTRFEDRLVTEQFTRAAPRHLPKPHIAWGFKTLGRPLGYRKLSCHRPNGLVPEQADRVRWVNGAGRPMPDGIRQRGWRCDRASVGYDLVQLNHYALRSAESFLVKRQRGRALHVDRQIGFNYWLRMDWSDHEDRSILRHLPRTRARLARLMQDPVLARLHRAAVDWHRDRATALRADPDFAALFAQATALRLTPTERAAWALALDMES